MAKKYKVPENHRYTKEHEWLRRDDVNDSIAIIGVTDYAQSSLGDVVHVELPEVGEDVELEDEIAVVESAKSASELYAPVTGKVIAVNSALDSNPEILNDQPYEDGWIMKIEMSDPDELDEMLSPEGYISFLDEEV